MKPCALSLAALLALAGPTVVLADTIYYTPSGVHDIETVTGKIVRETGNVLEVVTDDGRTLTIPRADVQAIIRDDPSAVGHAPDAMFSAKDPLERRRSRAPRAYDFGLKGGMNLANMSTDPQALEEEGSLKSFAVGAWWGVPLSRRLSLAAEALYSVKGDAESANGYTASTKMSYIDVPVLAKVGFLHGAAFQPSLFLGPSVAINLAAKSKLESGGSTVDVDVKDQVSPLDVGLVVGGGVDFPVGGRTYGLELRYARGLTNAADEGANGDAHNDVIAVMGSIALQ